MGGIPPFTKSPPPPAKSRWVRWTFCDKLYKTGIRPARVRVLGECMKIFVTGAVLLAGLALAGPAHAAPGQCSFTGYGSFACDVTADGGGITFALPDGQVFVFAHVADGEGIGYIGAAEPGPGRFPQDLGTFRPVPDEAGCWQGGQDGTRFCAALLQ